MTVSKNFRTSAALTPAKSVELVVNAEAPLDRFLDRLNGNVKGAITADGRVVMLAKPSK